MRNFYLHKPISANNIVAKVGGQPDNKTETNTKF
jgi:hypothetical protein